MIPVVEKMEIFPVAGHDCMELNLSGAHAPYFTRNIVILTDSNGVEGVGGSGRTEDYSCPGAGKESGDRNKHCRLQADTEQGS